MTEELKKRIAQINSGTIPTGYKRTKVGIVPEEWESKQIGQVLSRVTNPVAVEHDKQYRQIGIRSHGKGLFYKDEVSGSELGNKAVFWVEPNCFILNIVFAWEQAIGKTTEKEYGMIASHRFPMYKSNDLDIDYLIFYLLTKRGTVLLDLASPGGAGRNRTLGQDHFLKSKLVLPPLPEQQKIAEILTTQDEVIALLQKRIELKQQQKKALMQKLLSGELRVGDGEWITVKLGKLFSERSEQHCECLELLAITGKYGVIPRSQLDTKDNSSEDKSKYLKICKGDIGYNTMRMWQGVSAYSNYTGIVSPAYTILVPAEQIDALYFAYLFKTPKLISLFYRFSQGLVDDTRSLKYQNFKQISVRFPKEKTEQRKIAEILSAQDNEIELLQLQLALEQQKKKALMQLLLTGKVRVKT